MVAIKRKFPFACVFFGAAIIVIVSNRLTVFQTQLSFKSLPESRPNRNFNFDVFVRSLDERNLKQRNNALSHKENDKITFFSGKIRPITPTSPHVIHILLGAYVHGSFILLFIAW